MDPANSQKYGAFRLLFIYKLEWIKLKFGDNFYRFAFGDDMMKLFYNLYYILRRKFNQESKLDSNCISIMCQVSV